MAGLQRMGSLSGGLRRRPPSRLWVWRAWPLGGRLLARLALLARLRCPLRGLRFGWLSGAPRPSSLRPWRSSAPRVLAAAWVLAFGAGSSRPAVGAACPPFWLGASGIASAPPGRACGLWPLGGGPASAPVGAWVLALAAASLQLSRLSVAMAWLLIRAGCGLVVGVRPPPRPPVRPPTGGSQSSWRSGLCTNCSTDRTYICTDDSTSSSPLPPGG